MRLNELHHNNHFYFASEPNSPDVTNGVLYRFLGQASPGLDVYFVENTHSKQQEAFRGTKPVLLIEDKS